MTSGGPPSAGERRVAQLIDDTAPGIWDWDGPSKTFTVTPRLRQIFGFTPVEPVDIATLVATTHADDRGWAEDVAAWPAMRPGAPLLRRFRILKNGAQRWIAARIWSHGPEGAGHAGAVDDITEQTETAVALAESEERLRLAIEAGKMAVWEVDLDAQAMTQSPELNHLLGFPPGQNVTLAQVRALYNPGELERIQREGHSVEVIRARAHGGAFEPWRRGVPRDDRTQVQAEVAITTPGGVPKHLMLRSQYAPFADGRPRLTGLLIDITEPKQAEVKLGMVARELQHRVKNSLSVVYALATKTLRGKSDEAALATFLERLRALAAANDLILERGSSSAPLQQVIERIVRPYRDGMADPFTLDGPATNLRPDAAIASGMVLHELCTNAVKYGALSRPEGRIVVRWSHPSADRLDLTWEEHGGPVVEAPSRHGFGMRLLDSLLTGEGGKVTLDFQPAGVTCRIQLPVKP